jgi:hypothetical protein
MRSCILAVLFTGAVVSCTPLPELPQLEHADLVPPSLTGVVLADPRTLRVSFDEPAWLVAESVLCSSGITGTPEVRPGASGLDFVFADPPAPGVEHSVEAQVADERGNQLRFLIGFYGTNAIDRKSVV